MPVSDINVNSPSALQQQSRQAVAYTQGQGKPVASSGVTGYGKVQGKPFQGKPVSRGGGGYSVYVQPRPMVQTPVMQKIESPAVQQIRQKIAMGQFEQGGEGAVVLAVAQNVRNQRAISEFESQGQKLQQEIDLYNKSNIGDYKSLNQRVTEFNARGQELQQKLVNENKATNEKIQQLQAPMPFAGISKFSITKQFDVHAVAPQPGAIPRLENKVDVVGTLSKSVAQQQSQSRAFFGYANASSTPAEKNFIQYSRFKDNPVVGYSVGGALGLQTGLALGITSLASQFAGQGAYAVTGEPGIKGAAEFFAPMVVLSPQPKLTKPLDISKAMEGVETRYAGFGNASLVGNKTYFSLEDVQIISTPQSEAAIKVFGKEPLAYSLYGKGVSQVSGNLEATQFAGTFGQTGIAGGQRGIFTETISMPRPMGNMPLIGENTGLAEPFFAQEKGLITETNLTGNFFRSTPMGKSDQLAELQQSLMIRPTQRSYTILNQPESFETISFGSRQTQAINGFELAQQQTTFEYSLATNSFSSRNIYGEILFGPKETPIQNVGLLNAPRQVPLLEDTTPYFKFQTQQGTSLNELFRSPDFPLSGGFVEIPKVPNSGTETVVRTSSGLLMKQRVTQSFQSASATSIARVSSVSLAQTRAFEIEGSARSLGLSAGTTALQKTNPVVSNFNLEPVNQRGQPTFFAPSIKESNALKPAVEERKNIAQVPSIKQPFKSNQLPEMRNAPIVVITPTVGTGTDIRNDTMNKMGFGSLQEFKLEEKQVPAEMTVTGFKPFHFEPQLINPRPTIPNIPNLTNKRKRNLFNVETKSTSAFNVFVRRRGKFKLVGSNLPRGRATQLGASIAVGTLARSFKLAPSGFTQMQDVPFTASSNLFRPGRSRALAGAFVQRSRFSLSSAGERLEIRQARRSRRSML